jgi:hypothetical protein
MNTKIFKYLELFATIILLSMLISLLLLVYVFVTKQTELNIPGLFDQYILTIYNREATPKFEIGGNLSFKDISFFAFIITFIYFIYNEFILGKNIK